MPPHARWSLSLSWAKNSDKIEYPDSLSAGGAFRIYSNYLTFPSDADLAITKTDLSDPVVVGAQVQYTLTVTKYGPSDATGVVVTDNLPLADIASITLGTPSQGNASELGGVVTWNVGNLGAGSSAQLTITVQVKSSTPPYTVIVNKAAVTGDQYDPDLTNNGAAEETKVIPLTSSVPGISLWGGVALAVLFSGTLIWLVRRKLITAGRGR